MKTNSVVTYMSIPLVCVWAATAGHSQQPSAPATGLPQPTKSDSNAATLKGVLLIQWNDEKRFIYVVDAANPLRFQTKGGREIRPGRMYTDGGSIPRVFWAFKGFSPWGYAPAYVLHDWLFHQHRCKRDNAPNNYTFTETNQVLDDTIQILFKEKKVEPNETARGLIKWAVDNFAQDAWNESCDVEPAPAVGLSIAITVEKLSFGD